MPDRQSIPVDSTAYDRAYFCHDCEGSEEFVATAGRLPSRRLLEALAALRVKPGMRVLDAGCGRGESLVWLASRQVEAWGLDYASAALQLAHSALGHASPGWEVPPRLLAANVRQLPFASQSFERVLMLDVVEHLHPWELAVALREAWRVLRPGGKLLVHTAPNLWYYHYGYPLYRLFQRMRGVDLPVDPRDRFRYHRHVHVNEQTPLMLRRALREAGFRPHVWLADIQQRWAGQGRLACVLGWLAIHVYPLRWVFCGDILGEGCKE